MPFVTQRTFSARVVLAFRGTLAPEFGWLHKSSPTLPGHGGEGGGARGTNVGRQADAPGRPLPVLPAIYQTKGPWKQEFHTLLTMWLLSAGAGGGH